VSPTGQQGQQGFRQGWVAGWIEQLQGAWPGQGSQGRGQVPALRVKGGEQGPAAVCAPIVREPASSSPSLQPSAHLGRTMALEALLWDVDGTLAETERDGHRRAFNQAFAEAGVPIHWDGTAYGEWLSITGGRERIHAALRQLEGTEPDPGRVEALQARKQEHYRALLAEGGLALRPGVAALLAAAQNAGLRQVIVTTSARSAVAALLQRLLPEAAGCFAFWVCGEDVGCKKPHPEAYQLAVGRLGVPLQQLLVLEDSPAGLESASAAGLACVVTRSNYGGQGPLERFAGARAVLSGLGPQDRVLRGPACAPGCSTLSYLESLL